MDLTMPLDQFDLLGDIDPSEYVINMEEGDDGIWKAKSVTMQVQVKQVHTQAP